MVSCAPTEDTTATRNIDEHLGDEQRLTLLPHGSAESSGGSGGTSVKPLATEIMTKHGEIHNGFSFLHHLHIAISCTVSGAIVAVLTAAGCRSVEFIWQRLGSLTVEDGGLSGALWISPTCCLCTMVAFFWRLCTDHAQQSNQPREAALHLRSRYWSFYVAAAILVAMLAWPSCNNALKSRTGGVWKAEWTMTIVKGFNTAIAFIVYLLSLARDDDALKLKRESCLSDHAPLKQYFALVPKDGSFLRLCAVACSHSFVIAISVGLAFEVPFILTMIDLPRYAKSLSLAHSPLTRLALTVAAPVALRETFKVFSELFLKYWVYADTVNETPPANFIHTCIAVNAWGEFLAKWSIYASIGSHGSDLWHMVVLMIGQNALELIYAAIARTVPILHACAKTGWLSASGKGYRSDETERVINEKIRKLTIAAAVNRAIAHRMEYLSHSAAAAVLLMRQDSQSAQKQVAQVWALGILLELATDAVRSACIDTKSINLHLDPNLRFQMFLFSCEFCALCIFDATM